jgi:hypothetical protein
MLPVLLKQFRKLNFQRMRESIMSTHADPRKLLAKLSEMEMTEQAKADPEQFTRGVKELAGVLVDPKTNTQGLPEKKAELERAERVLKALERQKNVG